MRVGLGYDSHRFDSERSLILGGVHIPEHAGLAGHSDGDAVAHALTDALLGAAALGDVGQHFPDDDPAYEGADSMALLSEAVRLVEERGHRVVNADITIVTQSPRIAPWVDAMSENVARSLGVSLRAVSIKGKTNEGLGWIGRGEGLAVLATVLLDQIADLDTLQASIHDGG